MTRPVALALVSLLVAGPVLAQSLTEMAAREKARRKKAGGAARAFTDEDLKKARTATGPAAADSATSSAVDRPESSSESPAAESTRDAWRDDAARLHAAVSDAEKEVAAAQKNVDAARSSVGQPQPADGLRQLPVNPLIQEPAHEAAEKELADARAAADAARAALVAFEEKARKAGVPPGWLR